MRRDWATVVCFSCGKAGHSATWCPDLNETFLFMLPEWKEEKVGGGYVMISPAWQQSVAGRETETNPDRGSAARISIGTRPQDPGGGEAQLMASRDVATARPVVQPTSQSVLMRPESVGMSAVSVDAILRRRDWILSTVSDSVMVVTEELQRDY